MPLEKFQHGAPQSLNGDPRFTSKVSRLPGVAIPADRPEPADTQADARTEKGRARAEEGRARIEEGAPEIKAEPDQRSPAPAEKKAR